jgi:hypothetical protein
MADQREPRVVVIGPDGAVAPDAPGREAGDGVGGEAVPGFEAALSGGEDNSPLAGMVSRPDKVMRIATMVKQLLEEVRAAPLDDVSRAKLREIHRNSITELAGGLAPELREELSRLTLPLDETQTPSDAELRIAQAQLVGWLEGLFHGIQTALMAQQMAARAQLEEIRRRALPSAERPGGQPPEGFGRGAYL